MKKTVSVILILTTLIFTGVYAKEIQDITAKSYILLDGTTGNVLVEKDADIKLPPASITKIMTMLLAMEAIDKGTLNYEDVITVSETAAVHEGSHVFLETGEQITVHELLKAIAVASGNDASIAIAEAICGSQTEFVEAMNSRAKELGMKNTNFINCNGLDADEHVSCARDIGVMTCELMKHPKIFEYTNIWIDSLRNGEFQLANTNKLIRFYEGANGMKTGSTSKAGYCLSATAERNGTQLVAVVLNSPTSKERFADASALLNYGFSNYIRKNMINSDEIISEVNVIKGTNEKISIVPECECILLLKNNEVDNIERIISLDNSMQAPVRQGDCVGEIIFKSGNREVGRVNLISTENSEKISFMYLFDKFYNNFLLAI